MPDIECARCARPNEAGAQFCIHCGASLAPRVHCPSCDASQPLSNRFCLSCGAEMGHARWESAPASGAVVDGTWERGPQEMVRRVDPDDARSFLGRRVVGVPQGSVGVVVVDGVVERVLPPGQQTTVSLFERIANFFSGRERTAFYLVDLRPLPIPFTVTTRPSGEGRAVQTQVLVSFRLQRGDKARIQAFLGELMGDRPAFAAGDLFDQLRPEVTRQATRVLERLAAAGELSHAEAEEEIRRTLAGALGDRYGLGVDVSVAPLTTTASLSFSLGTGQAPRVRRCPGCEAELPLTMKFCDRCGASQPTVLSPDRSCSQCGEQVAPGDRFCSGCGSAYEEPPASATPLFCSDGRQVELDLVVRVQGQHDDFSAERIAPALVGACAAHLREVTLEAFASEPGFAAMEQGITADVQQALSAYGLRLVAVAVVDVRSKTGQWLLAARADLERARQDVLLGREWLEQRAGEVDLAELTFAQQLRHQRFEREAKLKRLQLELLAAQRERQLRADGAFRRDQEQTADRRRRQQLADEQAELDVAEARRAADRDLQVEAAAREVQRDADQHERASELEQIQHSIDKEKIAFEHEADLTRRSMELDADKQHQQLDLTSERTRRQADDAAYAERAQGDVAFDDEQRRSELQQDLAEREQHRQLDKLRAMAELDRELAEQEHQQASERREQLRGLSAAQMVAAQAIDLARTEGGGAAWAEAISSEQQTEAANERLEQAERHADEVKQLLREQSQALQKAASEQLDRMQALTERVLDGDVARSRGAADREVYERSMESMAQVAASRAAPPPAAAVQVAAGEKRDAGGAPPKSCSSCGAELRAEAQFCGSCGAAQ